MIDNLIEAASDKKAEDIIVLDLRSYSTITDYFMICSGGSHRQVQAVADEMLDRARTLGVRAHHIEGQGSNDWVLADFNELVVHVFHKERRKFYQLEHLWRDAVVYFKSPEE